MKSKDKVVVRQTIDLDTCLRKMERIEMDSSKGVRKRTGVCLKEYEFVTGSPFLPNRHTTLDSVIAPTVTFS